MILSGFQIVSHQVMKKPAIGANALTNTKRSEFNAGKYVPYVGVNVHIDIAREAVAQ
jgi:polyisoprenoid-binding protein YceI